jgi:hypothetical protein
MENQPYYTILIVCLLFNTIAFVAIWQELKRQQARQHDVVDQLTRQYAGLVLVLMDHGERLSRIEGLPFRPATVLEKFDADAQDAETQQVIEQIATLLNRRREERRST